jgi:hypothetical protein
MIMAYFKDTSMSGSVKSHTNFGNCLGIYYQNITDLRTKQFICYEVCSSDFDINFLSETWLNDVCYDDLTLPSARCAYAANAVGKDLDIFAIGAIIAKNYL